ncbi:unnamed protein product [Mytilus coruscus]|uniref:B box-type domain-containing protein n=1 Tax=Mytilus coruscus TaxID=42192 RepID=A0A6J8AJU3_MYTCO|nr:unnamed protein product [Mytilus coruscus]
MASRSGDADNAAMFVGYFDVEDSNNVDSCQQEIVTLEPLASTSRQREDAIQCVNIHIHDLNRVDDVSSQVGLSLITASLQSLSEGFSYYEEECDYEEELDSNVTSEDILKRHAERQVSPVLAFKLPRIDQIDSSISRSETARGITVEVSRGSSNSCAIPQCSTDDVPNVNKDGSAQQTTLVVDDGNSFDASQLLNEKVGPNVSENLGTFVNSLLTTQMTLTKRKELFDKYLRPGNYQLNFPIVNDVIYEQCIGSFGRSNDVKLHTIQSAFEGLNVFGDFSKQTNSIALLASSSYSLSQYRRTNLKQYLKDEYQSLCAPKTKLTDQLFGDDVVNKIKSLTEGKKMVAMVAQKSQFSNPSSTRGLGGFGGFRGFSRGRGRSSRRGGRLPLGRLFTKVIEINKASALNLNKGDFNAAMRLSSAALDDINWWCVNISNSSAPVQRGTPSITLTTDASLVGWGADCLGLSTGGQWSEEELNFIINLELQAVGDHTQLFITHSKPFKPVACATIVRWIKTVLKLAGIDTDMFKAHSTRTASTSAAFSAGMPINDILKAAGWGNESVFGRFYQKKIAPSTYLGDTILQHLELTTKMATASLCGPCSEENKSLAATKYCSDCEERLCIDCAESHDRFKAFKSHHVIDLSTVTSNIQISAKKICNIHPDMLLDYFCTNHEIVCCRACIPNDHRKCQNVMPLEHASKDVKRSALFIDVMQDITHLITTLKDLYDNRESNLQSLAQTKSVITKQISEVKSRLLKQIDNLEHDLHAELSSLHRKHEMEINKQKEEISQVLDSLKANENEIDFLKGYGSNSQLFLSLHQQVTNSQSAEEKVQNIV